MLAVAAPAVCSKCFGLMVQCAKDPVPIGVGYLAQYIVKPLLGYGIAKVLFQLL